MSKQNKPLVTFGLIAFKQEEYIREAVAGAFAQTYSPLQIILSDDGSTDKTFEIMQEMASQYQGPHQILLNRNEPNRGIGGHINQVMSLAKGELVVIAAGDDISLPERAEVMVEKWIELGGGAISIHSKVTEIDENGRELGIKKAALKSFGFVSGGIIGASHGWTRSIFQIFGELEPNLILEDQAIAFRSSLLDGVHYIDRPLVKYRIGGSSFPSGTVVNYDCIKRRWDRWEILTKQHLLDIRKIPDHDAALEEQLQRRIKEYELLQKLACDSKPFHLLWVNKISTTHFVLKRALKYIFPRLFRISEIIRRR